MGKYRPTRFTIDAQRHGRTTSRATFIEVYVSPSGALKLDVRGGNTLWISEPVAVNMLTVLQRAYSSDQP